MKNIMMKKRLLVIGSVLASVAIGCQVGIDQVKNSGSHVSDFSAAQNCGTLITIGQSSAGANAEGKFARLPAPVTITTQIIACGNPNAPDTAENWHAIGVGVERSTVMVEDKRAGSTVEAQAVVDASGAVNLYANNTLIMKMGNVPVSEVAMPIGLEPGLAMEIRAGSQKVDLALSKTIPVEQMSLWIVRQ
jgi:hypothetical protein